MCTKPVGTIDHQICGLVHVCGYTKFHDFGWYNDGQTQNGKLDQFPGYLVPGSGHTS